MVGYLPFEVGRRAQRPARRRPFSDYHGVVLEDGAELDPRALVRACGHVGAGRSTTSRPALAAFAPYVTRARREPLPRPLGGVRELPRGAGASARTSAAHCARRASSRARWGRCAWWRRATIRSCSTGTVEWKRQQYAETGVRDVLADAGTPRAARGVHESRSADFSGALSVLYAGDVVAGLHLGLRSGARLALVVPRLQPRPAPVLAGADPHARAGPGRAGARDRARSISARARPVTRRRWRPARCRSARAASARTRCPRPARGYRRRRAARCARPACTVPRAGRCAGAR